MTTPCAIKLDHGVIGNGSVLALAAPSTHIDWLCMPRFDSLSVFARILDVANGGTFAVQPDSGPVSTRMEYAVNTNVLRTEIAGGGGHGEVYDYAPRIPAGLGVDAPVEIQRLTIPREGAPRLRVIFDPRPDYGRSQQPPIVEVSSLPYLESGRPIRVDGPLFFALSYGKPSDTNSIESAPHVRDLTIAGWRAWANRARCHRSPVCRFFGPHCV